MTFPRFFEFRKTGALVLAIFLLAHVPTIAAAGPEAARTADAGEQIPGSDFSTYRLGAGDVITIRVFGEDDLSKERVRLTDAGTLSYSVLGEIKVQGLTVGDLQRIIADGLRGRYLVNPRVSVNIEEYRPFYINGMVERPGGYPYQPGLTIRKASLLAGGFKERASTSKIYIIREGDRAQRSQKADLSTNVGPGDIVTVEESFF
ncbi:MAG: polysaccharide export protein [Proteobacteria bacterium]|nr:polysaccharide export protein [Pseudomonadota bacterium]